MTYSYRCNNEKCKVKEVIINKPMAESGKIEYCQKCGSTLVRCYITSIVTGDGFK